MFSRSWPLLAVFLSLGCKSGFGPVHTRLPETGEYGFSAGAPEAAARPEEGGRSGAAVSTGTVSAASARRPVVRPAARAAGEAGPRSAASVRAGSPDLGPAPDSGESPVTSRSARMAPSPRVRLDGPRDWRRPSYPGGPFPQGSPLQAPAGAAAQAMRVLDELQGLKGVPAAASADAMGDLELDSLILGSYRIQMSTAPDFSSPAFEGVYPFNEDQGVFWDITDAGVETGVYWLRFAFIDILEEQYPFTKPREFFYKRPWRRRRPGR